MVVKAARAVPTVRTRRRRRTAILERMWTVRSWRSSAVAVSLLVGCQDGAGVTELPLASFAPLCGADEPIRLLALANDEMINGGPVVRRYDDRLVYVVAAPAAKDGHGPETQLVVRSTGLCGEDTRTLIEDVSLVEAQRGFEQLAVCDASGRSLLLHADGTPASTLLEGTGCEVWAAGSGVVGLVVDERGDTADVVFRASTKADGVESLAQAVRGPNELAGAPIAVSGTEVFFVTQDDRLVALDTIDRVETILAEAVGGFGVSADGRYLIWQDVEPFAEGVASHPIHLLDRETSALVDLGWGTLETAATALGEGFAAAYADPALGGLRVVLLPELTPLLLGQGRAVLFRLSDEWAVLQVQSLGQGGTGLVVFDVVEHEDVASFDGATWLFEHGDGYDILARPDPAVFELWRWDPADAQTRYVAAVNGGYRRISDHQIVLGHETGRAGDLVVLDDRTGQRRLVDRDAWLGPRASSIEGPLGPGTIVYEVFAGDRTGVWAARVDATE